MPLRTAPRRAVPLVAAALAVLLSACALSSADPPPDAGGDGGTGSDGGTGGDGGSGGDGGTGTLAEQLERLSGKAMFFSHQSVGANIVGGVRVLLEGNAGPEPAVLGMDGEAFLADGASRTSQLSQIHAGTWAEWYWSSSVPDNCSASQKLVEFRDAVTAGVGGAVDVAFLKLCYADFWDQCNADPAALFATYRSTMAQLRAAHPGVTFVHFTVPLWTRTDTNARRERFSDLVRQEYGGREPVFDIALVESTRPDGSRERDELGVPALVPSYTDDGGHLNAAGKDVVARALVAFLASLP